MNTAREARARRRFKTFVEEIPQRARIAILHDWDADGITSAVILEHALRSYGFTRVRRVFPDRERNAWTPANRKKVAALRPERLFVLDLGSQSEPVLPGVPTLFVDHHQPEGVPTGDTLISSYDWNPIPNTSLLMHLLCEAIADVSHLDWIAAIGAVSDLGEKAPFDVLRNALLHHRAKYVKEATTLINSIRRAASADPEAAARALLRYTSPRALVEAQGDPDVDRMHQCREEVRVAMNEAKKAAPVFSGKAALIRMHSPCQIHPLIAQIWRTRLPGYIVISANTGYLPGRVNFSARAVGDRNVLEFLRSVVVAPGAVDQGSYGHGHDQASGGSLPYDRWNSFLEALGFPESVRLKLDAPKKVAA